LSLRFDFLDKRPLIIALAGSNGAGKSTFYDSYLADGGLRFINADELSASLGMLPYDAAELAASIRRELVSHRESFIFETVLSDPVGEKVDHLVSYEALGYTVVLIFIRIESPDESIKRVAMRASQGGHDVPDAKLRARFARTQANLKRAIQRLPHVIVYSNEDLSNPYQFLAYYENGQMIERGTTP
jgi:predicted ABC-type ATPase